MFFVKVSHTGHIKVYCNLFFSTSKNDDVLTRHIHTLNWKINIYIYVIGQFLFSLTHTLTFSQSKYSNKQNKYLLLNNYSFFSLLINYTFIISNNFVNRINTNNQNLLQLLAQHMLIERIALIRQ